MTDVIIVCSTFDKYSASFRRLDYFITYLNAEKIKVKCLSALNITNNGLIYPIKYAITASIVICHRSPITSILNIILSFTFIVPLFIFRPKIVIISIPGFSELIPVYLISRLMKSKIIIDLRDPAEESVINFYSKNKIEKFLAKLIKIINYSLYTKCDVLVTVTRSLKGYFERELGRNVIIVPNGADLNLFKPLQKEIARNLLGIDNDTFIISFIGQIGGYYDISRFLYLLANIVTKHRIRVKLILAGPIFDNKIKKLLESNLFKDIVLYLGLIDVKKIVCVLSASDLGLIPLENNPVFDHAIPVKLYEYIASGLPVIAILNENSEAAKLIKENHLGIVCKHDDYNFLENMLISIIENPEILNELRSHALNFRYQIDRSIGAKKLLKIIKQHLD